MRKHIRKIFAWLTIVAGVAVLHGEAAAQGTAGFEILRLQTYSRGSSLAGALVADAGNIESSFYNPAGLATLSRRTAIAGYMNYLLDIESGYMAYVDPSFFWGVWGVTLNYTNYGKFDGRSPTGEDLGTFTASDVVFGVVYANQIRDKISVGGAAKWVYSDIQNYTGSALAFDLGGQYTLIKDRLRLGAGIYNLGLTTKAFVNYQEDLPLYYRIGIWGVPKDLPANLYFSMTMYHEYADNYSLGDFGGSKFMDFLGDIYYGIGAEFHPMEVIYLRVGYDTRGFDQKVGTRKDALAGISGGIGFDFNIARVDFSLASQGELGLVQRLSVSAGL